MHKLSIQCLYKQYKQHTSILSTLSAPIGRVLSGHHQRDVLVDRCQHSKWRQRRYCHHHQEVKPSQLHSARVTGSSHGMGAWNQRSRCHQLPALAHSHRGRIMPKQQKWFHRCCYHTWDSAPHSMQAGSCLTPLSAWSRPRWVWVLPKVRARCTQTWFLEWRLYPWGNKRQRAMAEEKICNWQGFHGHIYTMGFPCIQIGWSRLASYFYADFQWGNMWSW